MNCSTCLPLRILLAIFLVQAFVSFGNAQPYDNNGDFNGDGVSDCDDIDALVVAIVAVTTDLSFDLTGDGIVDTADRDAWLAVAGEINNGPGQAYLHGDADLNGSVDVSDFNTWNGNRFTSTPAWCEGDFTADGVIDVRDFFAWNQNKFTSSRFADPPEEPIFTSGVNLHAVPEPQLMAFLLPIVIVVMSRRSHPLTSDGTTA